MQFIKDCYDFITLQCLHDFVVCGGGGGGGSMKSVPAFLCLNLCSVVLKGAERRSICGLLSLLESHRLIKVG